MTWRMLHVTASRDVEVVLKNAQRTVYHRAEDPARLLRSDLRLDLVVWYGRR